LPAATQAAFDGRLDHRNAFIGGVGADAFVFARGDFAETLGAGGLVDRLHLRRDRHDFIEELAFAARLRRLLLAVDAEAILHFAADAIALSDVLGGHQHRPVHGRLVRLQPLFLEHVAVHFILHAGDRLHAAGDIALGLAGQDALRGERDGLQARRTEAVDRHARHRHRHACTQRRLARDVPARRPLGVRAAEDHVVDFAGLDSCALDRRRDHVAAHRRAMGDVERALPALAERGAGGGYDYGVGHAGSPRQGCCRDGSRHFSRCPPQRHPLAVRAATCASDAALLHCPGACVGAKATVSAVLQSTTLRPASALR
jgi:hypothetical protein